MTTSVNANTNERRGSISPLLTTVVGGATGGYLIGETLNSKYLLDKDTVELSKKVDAALKQEKGVYDKVISALTGTSKDKIDSKIAEYISADAIDIDASKYLGNMDDFKAGLEKSKGEVDDLIKAIKDAPDKVAKKIAQNALDLKKSALNADENILKAITQDGKVSKAALSEHISSTFKNKAAKSIDEALKSFTGKLPKVFSKKNMIIGSIAGLMIGLILSKNKDKS